VRNERTDVLSHELDALSADERAALLAALSALERLAERLLQRPVPTGREPGANSLPVGMIGFIHVLT